METITAGSWQGRLDAGLPRRQLEALLLAANDMTHKEIARQMGIAPDSARQRLDDARFKLGMQKTVRGLCLEAFKRGIIAPLMVALLVGAGNVQQMQPVRRPEAPRVQVMARTQRVDDVYLAA
ncbi:sigma factor-like helix-turn-helix DNA-binding protein [Pseudomonas sp. B392_1p]|uniref:sigma factor-like helix-turn-helix DNA-binding protein n=1 Tax=Pseudomonas sp. B392_1p TaxID=3457507 RepID=UPI003FD4CB96